MSEHLTTYLEQWPAEQTALKHALLALRQTAQGLPGVAENFVARPGISHSLRYDLAPKPAGRRRPVFFLIDVVEAADERFLSVCFYDDEIEDPRELGNAIPQGLFQETGYCFDLEEDDPELVEYLRQRVIEAWGNAGRG